MIASDRASTSFYLLLFTYERCAAVFLLFVLAIVLGFWLAADFAESLTKRSMWFLVLRECLLVGDPAEVWCESAVKLH